MKNEITIDGIIYVPKEVEEIKTKWQCIGELEWSEPLGELNWNDATKKCKEMGGRLPTRIELIDLVDNHVEEIEDWGGCLWSATTQSYGTHGAWRVNLGYGYMDYDTKVTESDSRCCRRVI